MKMQDKKAIEELSDWIQVKLKFIDSIIREAKSSCNYGKEIQYVGMREAYVEFLNKLDADQQNELAA